MVQKNIMCSRVTCTLDIMNWGKVSCLAKELYFLRCIMLVVSRLSERHVVCVNVKLPMCLYSLHVYSKTNIQRSVSYTKVNINPRFERSCKRIIAVEDWIQIDVSRDNILNTIQQLITHIHTHTHTHTQNRETQWWNSSPGPLP